jgi:hypothetical protein
LILTNRTAEARTNLRGDPRHPCDLGRGGVRGDGQIAEILHHEGLDAVFGERASFFYGVAQYPIDVTASIARTSRQGAELHHADDRLCARLDEGQEFAHLSLT